MKISKVILILAVPLLMTSCYSSHITVGNMTHEHPVKKVGSKKNHYLFAGLIPLSRKQNARDYVGDAKHYKVRTSHKFIDVLIGSLTGTIYTPITVTYYMSDVEVNKKYQREREMFDRDDELEFDSGDDFLDFDNFEPKKNTKQRKFEDKDEFVDIDEFRDFDEPIKTPPAKKEKKQQEKKQEPRRQSTPPARDNSSSDEQNPSIEQIRRQIEKDRIRHEQRMKEIEDLKRKMNE